MTPDGFTGVLPAVRRTGLRTTERPQCITLRPFCTMVDWLSVMMMGPWSTITTEIGDAFRWDVENVRPGLMVYRTYETPHFAKVFYISDQVGTKLVTVLCQPKDHKKFPPEFMVAEFGNATLATGEWRELLSALEQMGCEHMGVKKCDIAADGWEGELIGDGGDFIPVVQASLAGWGNYYGKAHWKTHHLGRAFNGFEFGSRAGNKFMRCYRKKREMKDKGLKPHIVEAWRAALGGMDPMKDPREVGRLEVSLKGTELRRYFKGESDSRLLAELHDPLKRVELFQATTDTMFDFRTWPTDGRARSAKPMHRWDWGLCTTNAPAALARAQRSRCISPEIVKRSVHALYDMHLHSYDPRFLVDAEIAAAAGGPEIVTWFHGKMRQWDQLHEALTVGTRNRPGASDDFSLSFMRRLREGVREAADPLRDFHEAAAPVEWEEMPAPPPPPKERAATPPPPHADVDFLAGPDLFD